MKQDWLDKNLGDKFDGYDSPMDLENAWESLQTKRQTPKKKNKFFFFWVIFGLVTIGAGGSYSFLNNQVDSNSIAYANAISEADNILKNENQRFGKTESSSPTLSNSKKINQNNPVNDIATETKTILNTSKNIGIEGQTYSDQKKAKSNLKENTSFYQTKNNLSLIHI